VRTGTSSVGGSIRLQAELVVCTSSPGVLHQQLGTIRRGASDPVRASSFRSGCPIEKVVACRCLVVVVAVVGIGVQLVRAGNDMRFAVGCVLGIVGHVAGSIRHDVVCTSVDLRGDP